MDMRGQLHDRRFISKEEGPVTLKKESAWFTGMVSTLWRRGKISCLSRNPAPVIQPLT
jgi:hypothetical protein